MGDIDDNYEILGELGGGAQGKLYVGMQLDSGRRVALKELDLSIVDEWKAIELFEREADALESLDHPGIPAYIDDFQVDSDEGTRFFLVQQFVDGAGLDERLEAADLMDEDEARRFLVAMLDILSYLQRLSPPIVHRDIKPSNILERPDGSFALIDFGAVQTILPDADGGSTVVGTTGYMPPEQLMGRAGPASDLYALGATTVAMLSGIEPEDMLVERMKLQFRDHIDVSDEFADLLDRLLEPTVEQRVQKADEALEALESGKLPAPANSPLPARDKRAWRRLQRKLDDADELKPRAPYADIDVTPSSMVVTIPPMESDTKTLLWPVGALVATVIAGAFNCCLVPAGLAVTGFLAWGVRDYVFPRSQRLVVDAEHITVEWLRDGAVTKATLIDTQDAYLPYVERMGGAAGVSNGESSAGQSTQLAKPFWGSPGLILTDSNDNKAVFAQSLMTKNQLGNTGANFDDGELDWLEAKLMAYLEYLRGGGDD